MNSMSPKEIAFSREAITEVIDHLGYSRHSRNMAYLKALFSHAGHEEGFSSLSLDPTHLIEEIWNTADPELLRSRRKNLSTIRTSINRDLAALYRNGNNPEGITISPDHALIVSQEAKEALYAPFANHFKPSDLSELEKAGALLEALAEMAEKEGKPMEGTEALAEQLKRAVTALEKNGIPPSHKDEPLPTEEEETDEPEEVLEEDEFEEVAEEELDEDEELLEDEDDTFEEVDENDLDEEEELLEDELDIEDEDDAFEEVDEDDLDEEEELLEDELDLEDEDDAFEEVNEDDLDEEEELLEDELDLEDEDDAFEEVEEDDLDEEEELLEDELDLEDEDDAFEEVDEDDLDEEEELLEDELDLEDEDDAFEEVDEDDLDEEEELLEDELDLEDEDDAFEEVDEDDLDEEEELLEDELDLEDEDDAFEEVDEDDLDEEEELLEDEDDIFEEVPDAPRDPNLPDSAADEDPDSMGERASRFESLLNESERYYNRYIHIPKGRYPTIDPLTGQEAFVGLEAFLAGKYPITNALFEVFISRTGYKTTAEERGFGAVYEPRLSRNPNTRGISLSTSRGLRLLRGANWHKPSGLLSSVHTCAHHPVVQVSFEDAMAFASWTGKQLPTLAQWLAAGGKTATPYPWGEAWESHLCNTEEVGAGGTLPVDTFPSGASPFGVYDLMGNAMEWVCDLLPEREGEPVKLAAGGSFLSDRSLTRQFTHTFDTRFSSNVLGFRCVGW